MSADKTPGVTAVARITVSLRRELKERLEACAEEGGNRSARWWPRPWRPSWGTGRPLRRAPRPTPRPGPTWPGAAQGEALRQVVLELTGWVSGPLYPLRDRVPGPLPP
jgi:hypothetical protein